MSTPKAYHGSCHCGDVQYQIKLIFPPILESNAQSIRIYKCNCSTCQKMGIFHVRPISPSDDFILTSPSTIEELGDYRVFKKKIGWYFCKKCGVRVFGMGGQWVQEEIDVEKWAGEEGSGKAQKVWKSEGASMLLDIDGEKQDTFVHYLSANAVTLEPTEELDLRKWHENGWIYYVENREDVHGKVHHDGPLYGGIY